MLVPLEGNTFFFVKANCEILFKPYAKVDAFRFFVAMNFPEQLPRLLLEAGGQ